MYFSISYFTNSLSLAGVGKISNIFKNAEMFKFPSAHTENLLNSIFC